MRTTGVRHRAALCAAKNLVLSAKRKKVKLRLDLRRLRRGRDGNDPSSSSRSALRSKESRPLRQNHCEGPVSELLTGLSAFFEGYMP